MTKTWTGKDAGVRKPMTGETQLSPSEVAHGLRDGVFKKQPATKRHSAPKVKTTAWGDVAKGILAFAQRAGCKGMTWADIKAAHPDWKPQTVSSALKRHLESGALQRRGKGGQIRFWAAGVTDAICDAGHAADRERSRQTRKDKRREYSERHRRAVGNMALEEYRAYQAARTAAAKSEQARQRIEKAAARKLEIDARKAAKAAEREAKASAEARAAVRKETAEARKLEAELKALEAQEAAAKSTKRHITAIKRATANINRIADKYRGTTAPSIVQMPQARPKAAPVEIPPHLITVCRPMTLPHERIQPTGSFGRIGEYDTEPGHLALALGVTA